MKGCGKKNARGQKFEACAWNMHAVPLAESTMGTTTESKSKAEHLKPYSWKPGQSGNPGGRRKRVLSDRYQQLMESLLPREIATAMKLPVGVLWADAIALISARTALKPNECGILQRKEIREACEGKATQRVEFHSEEEVCITVSFENLLGAHKPAEIIDVEPGSTMECTEELPADADDELQKE